MVGGGRGLKLSRYRFFSTSSTEYNDNQSPEDGSTANFPKMMCTLYIYIPQTMDNVKHNFDVTIHR
jgi:hypothetical protein